MLLPVGNLVGALAARNVDVEYVEWGWFLFAIGILLWLALWPMTLGKVSDRIGRRYVEKYSRNGHKYNNLVGVHG